MREGLERPAPMPRFVARLAPAGADARAVAEAAATFEAITRLHGLTQRLIAEVDSEAESSSPLAPAELDDLNNLLETAWRSWRQGLRPREPAISRSS